MKALGSILCTSLFVAAGMAQTGKPANYLPPSGYVPDATTAIKVAEAVLLPVYGEKVIDSERPFTASLGRSGIWTVSGTLHCATGDTCDGGVAIVTIAKKDGRILSMIHEK
jgi:hypothetical protein